MRNRKHVAWILGALLVTPFAWAGEDEAENSGGATTPSVIAVMFRNPTDAGSKKLEKDILPALRKEFADKAVLFVTVDVATKTEKHQSKMLCGLLGLESLWNDYASKPGHIVLYKYTDDEVGGVIDGKTDAKKAAAALKGALSERVPIEEDEDEDKDMETDG